jgi:hypothetical protein
MISLLFLVTLHLSATGCSPAFLREKPANGLPLSENTGMDNQGLNTKLMDKQMEVLQKRIASRGGQPSETETVSALDSFNLRLSRNPIENPALTKGLREMGVGLLEDPSEEVRFRACEFLGKTATESEEPALLKISETDPSATVREMALEALELRGLGEEVWEEG